MIKLCIWFAKIQATGLNVQIGGYLALDMLKQGQIILLFWWIDTTHLILRYDKNFPTPIWRVVAVCNEDLNLALFDVGDTLGSLEIQLFHLMMQSM
jgi:hypothetical protein